MKRSETDRAAAVAECVNHIRYLEQAFGVTREALDHIAEEVIRLGQRADLFPFEDFPIPEGQPNKLYRLSIDGDDRFAIYLNVSAGHVKSPPHDHTTWAVVAGVQGVERNVLYDRLDDGSVEGRAEIRPREEVEVRPGVAVRLLPDDIHAIELAGDEPKMHLHCYGLALHRLDDRVMFDADAGTYRPMPLPGSAR